MEQEASADNSRKHGKRRVRFQSPEPAPKRRRVLSSASGVGARSAIRLLKARTKRFNYSPPTALPSHSSSTKTEGSVVEAAEASQDLSVPDNGSPAGKVPNSPKHETQA